MGAPVTVLGRCLLSGPCHCGEVLGLPRGRRALRPGGLGPQPTSRRRSMHRRDQKQARGRWLGWEAQRKFTKCDGEEPALIIGLPTNQHARSQRPPALASPSPEFTQAPGQSGESPGPPEKGAGPTRPGSAPPAPCPPSFCQNCTSARCWPFVEEHPYHVPQHTRVLALTTPVTRVRFAGLGPGPGLVVCPSVFKCVCAPRRAVWACTRPCAPCHRLSVS